MKALCFAVAIVCFAFALGCDDQRLPLYAEIVRFHSEQSARVELSIQRFIDPPTMPRLANDSLVFVSRTRLLQNNIYFFARLSSSFDQLALAMQKHLELDGFKPNLSIKDNIARGRTFESVLALSAFCHLEEIAQFAQRFEARGKLQFKRPLNVAIYGEVFSSQEEMDAIAKSDNALYVASADMIFLLPPANEQGLPLAMHEGVLAHEFHHRIFFNKVWRNPGFENLWSVFLSRYDGEKSRISKRSRIILNSLDEGLADTFAVAFTGLPNYLNVSLTERASETLRLQRNLNGLFAQNATYDSLRDALLPTTLMNMCGEKSNDFTNQKFNVYCLGTIVAKAIYEASSRDINVLRKKMLPLIFLSLDRVAEAVDKEILFDVDIFLAAMVANAKKHSPELVMPICDEIKKRFSSLVTKERLPACLTF